MRDIQISRPVLIALVGAVLVGGFLYYKSSSSSDDFAPPAPATAAATGATGGSTGATGRDGKKAKKAAAASIAGTKEVPTTTPTGASGPTMTVKELAQQKAREKRQKVIAAAEAAGMPLSVYEPLQKGKTVLIFFYEPKGRDDERVNDAVLNVEAYRGSSLVVKREKIENKSDYDGIAKAAEITQTPGIVILYHSNADNWQGYIDSSALNARIKRVQKNATT
jgi:hypothetical protein